MRHIVQSDGSILFRTLPPAGFVFRNYAPVPGNPYHYRPVFAFDCKYRTMKELRSGCGKHLLGYDFTCNLDCKGVSFSICNECDPETKRLLTLDLKASYVKRSADSEHAKLACINQTDGCEDGESSCVLGEESAHNG